jgi:uncharacterized protein (DUF305 family)
MKARYVIFAVAFAAVSSVAVAESPKPAMQVIMPSEATQAYMKAMQGMDQSMQTMKPTGDPSMDFVMMMKPHHQAAVDMAEAYLKYGKDPRLTKMAQDIIKSQKEEINEMNAWESKHKM